jgi:ATP-dependent RNA helicase RhlB
MNQPSDSRQKRGFLTQVIEWLTPFRSRKASPEETALPSGPTSSFADFDLSEPVRRGVEDAGFLHPTPIQSLALPIALAGTDVAGQAQTGTGKTAAFLITIFERLLAMDRRKPGVPTALVIAPTRELVLQIRQDAEVLGRYTGLRTVAVFGGMDYHGQASQLREGADIVIATPGRLIDYMKQRAFLPDRVKILVVDEADRLFDLGFIKDLRYILRRLPSYEKRQSLLFSATLSPLVLELTYQYMNAPKEIYVSPEEVTVESVEQLLFHVAKREKLALLLGILAREPWGRVLIFVNTKAGVEWLAARLRGNGYPAQALTGDLDQRRRLRLLEQFKSSELKILVASDVASRGLHVEDISHVINYDLPLDREDYVHRIGRTARAGRSGRALSLACEDYVYRLEAIEEYLGKKIPVVWPEAEWFLPDRSQPAPRTQPARKRRPVEGGGRERNRRTRSEPRAGRTSEGRALHGDSPSSQKRRPRSQGPRRADPRGSAISATSREPGAAGRTRKK